jgi:hypothetical protein
MGIAGVIVAVGQPGAACTTTSRLPRNWSVPLYVRSHANEITSPSRTIVGKGETKSGGLSDSARLKKLTLISSMARPIHKNFKDMSYHHARNKIFFWDTTKKGQHMADLLNKTPTF